MEKNNKSDIPKPFIKIEAGSLLQLMEDLPPYLDRSVAIAKRKYLMQEMEINTRVILHNNRFFIYRIVKLKNKNG